ncbi:ankyrin repeat-containing protein BDA1-like [Malania oleifera]|uniref:ankyrin repeat-containing protein BDA1-like n=1 Tax=Malania oleifera TaxID=397392 RepID=UPI0025AE4207|nr:ankyrin repeat-containing protein BDA1-like [Malania oleifera]
MSEMDRARLLDAARTGNVDLLHQLLQENPLILTDAALESPKETPLHAAAKAGQVGFMREVIKHKPEFAAELNNEGFRPMDIAAAMGNLEMVRELLKANDHEQVSGLKGRNQRTALHYAAMYGRAEIIEELMVSNPEYIKDVTARKETALHLAVKNYQFEALGVLVGWLEKLNLKMLANWADCDGNTVLHLAASRKQLESIELLLDKSNGNGGILTVNAKNSKGLTAMDVLDIVMETPDDVRLKEIFSQAGARGAKEHAAPLHQFARENAQSPQPKHIPSDPPEDWFKYFKFQKQRDSPSNTRNVLLVVAALIATVTFQAGINPPSGLVESPSTNSTEVPPSCGSGITVGCTLPNPPRTRVVPLLGLTVASENFGFHTTAKTLMFLFGNTLALTASLSIIIYLTGGFPFQRELWVAICCMMFCYGNSIITMTNEKKAANILMGVASVLPFSMRWLPRWARKGWKWWRHRSATRRTLPIP